MMHFSCWPRAQKIKKDLKDEALMDSILNALGLWRKPIAKDGFYLYRAVSEKLFGTQAYYFKLYKITQRCFQKWNGIEDDSYLLTDLDGILTLSRKYEVNFIIYETAGNFTVNKTNYGYGYQKKIELCRLEDGHLECVYPRSYMQDAAICQSIVYEILYRHVFKLNTELEEAVQLIQVQNKSRRRLEMSSTYRSPSGSPESSHSSKSSEDQDVDLECSIGRSTYDLKERCARKTIPPLPYRIAKALDPFIYRNTELDIWEEERREALHRERYLSVTFAAGDKCRVVSEEGPLYHGHIQELNDSNQSAIVFIEEIGEKKEVALQSLHPAKSNIKSGWAYKQYRRKKSLSPEMPVAQVVNGNMPQLPPPAVVPKNVNPSIRPTNPVLAPFPVQCNGNPVPSELLIPPRPELRLPIPHSQGYVMSPDTVPMVTNTMMLQQPPVLPPPFQSNPPHMPPSPATHAPQYSSNQPPPPPSSSVSVTSPCNQVTPAGNGQMYPCIWVPYMDSISLGQVDVNAPPSKEISGVDLPMTDTNTLRFFYNLGVEHYRSISQLSFSLAKETSSIGQSPVVYCQSKIPNEVKFVTPPNCTSSKDVNSLVSEKNSDNSPVPESSKESESHLNMAATEMDEKGSMSSDSGCESLTGCNVNESKGNDENSKDHISKDIINESVLEKITTSSDMSISDTNDGAISLADSQDQVTKTTKPRRKYYMYGNLKLVKPIKEIPKRFLTMLNSINAEKSRVEGEPIILSPPTMPPSEEFQFSDLVPYHPGLNLGMPCCVQNSPFYDSSQIITNGDGSHSNSSHTNSSCSSSTSSSNSDSKSSPACSSVKSSNQQWYMVSIPPPSSSNQAAPTSQSTSPSTPQLYNPSCNSRSSNSHSSFNTTYTNHTLYSGFAPGSSYATQSTGTVYFADKAYPGDLNTYGTPFVAPVTPGLECGTSQPQAALPPPPPPPALAYSISHQVSAQMALAAPPQ